MKKITQSGFSLVELMVVVAIIGILATVAIPRVTRFIAKSRQTEAQTNLAAIHTANKAFFNEFQGYTSSFTAMGYSPEGQLRYNAGFTTGSGAGPNNYMTVKNITSYPTVANSKEVCGTTIGTGSQCVRMFGADNADQHDITFAISSPYSTFTAGAEAQLVDGGSSSTIPADVWTINETRELVNTSDGTGN